MPCSLQVVQKGPDARRRRLGRLRRTRFPSEGGTPPFRTSPKLAQAEPALEQKENVEESRPPRTWQCELQPKARRAKNETGERERVRASLVGPALGHLFAKSLHVSVRLYFLGAHSRRGEKRADR